jgi:hypothetical protein
MAMPIKLLSRIRGALPPPSADRAAESAPPAAPPAQPPLSADSRAVLLAEAKDSVARAAVRDTVRLPDPSLAPEAVRRPANSFVTVTLEGRLRGCVGSLNPLRPLIVDVADNGYRAAAGDPRFPPMTPEEAERAALTVAVLGPAEPLEAASEAALIALLVPGRDGVILAEGGRRGLFLPKVWETVPDPVAFLGHLKAKAGLPPDYWSPRLRAWRFGVESFGEDA